MTGGRRDSTSGAKAAHRRMATRKKVAKRAGPTKAEQRREDIAARKAAREHKRKVREAERAERQQRREAKREEREIKHAERVVRREKAERAIEFVRTYQPKPITLRGDRPPELPDCKCGHTERVHGVIRRACMNQSCNCGKYEEAS